MEDFQKDHCTRLTLSKCNILASNLFLEVKKNSSKGMNLACTFIKEEQSVVTQD